MAGIRVIIHSAAFLIGALIIGVITDQTGSVFLVTIVAWISWWHYVPFAIAGSCGLHQHWGMTFLLTVGVVLLDSPQTAAAVGTLIVPIMAGLLTGLLIRYFTITEIKHDTTAGQNLVGEPGAHDSGDQGHREWHHDVGSRQARTDPPQPRHGGAGIPDHRGIGAGDRRPALDAGGNPRLP
jgi:hypothetical protein